MIQLRRLAKSAIALSACYLLAVLATTWVRSDPIPIFGEPSFRSRFTMFFGTLAVVYTVYAIGPVRTHVAHSLNRIAASLADRGAFRSDSVAEAPKFAMLRILFGVFLVERAFWILVHLQPSDWREPSIFLFAVSGLISGLMVLLGIFTQFVLAFLVLVQWQIGDLALATFTLGNMIAALLAFLLAFANGGAHFSVDRRLIRRGGGIGRLVAKFYYRDGTPSTATLQLAKAASLAGFWLISLYSLSAHLNEPAWMNGTAGPLLLSNNFMSRFSEAFTAFFGLGEWAIWVGRLALWSMLPWYVAVLPLVILGGAFRRYVILWGLLFFMLSLVVLQLGWLAHFELLLLVGWFWQPGPASRRDVIRIGYNGACGRCARTARFIQALDIFERTEVLATPRGPCPPGEAEDACFWAGAKPHHFSVGSDELVDGYELYVLLSRRLGLLQLVFPLLAIGRRIGGPAVYRFLADRAVRPSGLLQVGTHQSTDRPTAAGYSGVDEADGNDPILPLVLHFAVLGAAFLLAIPAPYINWDGFPMPGELATRLRDDAASSAYIYGIAPLNVFNEGDLRMAENWFVISGIRADGAIVTLPILTDGGTRLDRHRSDRVYFGHTLRIRRSVIGLDTCFFERHEDDLRYLIERDAASGNFVEFEFRQYRQTLPPAEEIIQGRLEFPPASVICTESFQHD